MSFLTPSRRPSDELLDDENAPMAEVVRSLEDLRWINRYAGGLRIYRSLLQELVPPGPVSILDIGTGTSDLPESVIHLGRPSCGLDFKLEHLAYGRQTGSRTLRRVAGNAFHLPFRDESFDVVTSGHFFHHFSLDENRVVIAEALRVAKVGVAINDTRRHIAPLLFVKLMALTSRFGSITKLDAPASVLQAYTLEEIKEFAQTLSARKVRVGTRIPFRFGLLLWK